MRRVLVYKKLLFISITLFQLSLFAQKEISITIDDPNTYETPLMNWKVRNDRILKGLKKHNVKAALFVCGMRVNDDKGKNIVRSWDLQNHLICNHSYSHYNYNSITSANFINDFIKGDSVIKDYNNYTKLFRFPYLKEGNTSTKRDSMRFFLLKSNYKHGAVTVDASDWYIDSEIIKVLKKDINTDLTPYKEYYINHIIDRVKYYDSITQILLNKDIKHTLLIHHSLLNALFIDDLLNALKMNGWNLINAKQAYNDSIFLEQPLVEPCGESIIYQFATLNKELSATLRYPAEDGKYEKELLEDYINKYISRKAK